MWLKLFAVYSKHNIIATVQTACYHGAKCRPVYTSQGRLMYDNGRRLLANRETCTFIGLNDVLGQTSFRQQIQNANRQLLVGVNERAN